MLRPRWNEQLDMQSVDYTDRPKPEWNSDEAEAYGYSKGFHTVDVGTVQSVV